MANVTRGLGATTTAERGNLYAEPLAARLRNASRLRAAALVVNHAPESGESDSESAAASWRALVAGCWRLVDQFESGGRHVLIAVRNDAETAPRIGNRTQQVLARRALGYSLKVIADELGISIATVSREIARGSIALGASTPECLTRLVR